MQSQQHIKGERKKIRRSLFVSRKHTLTEVYRIEALFKETGEAVANIENLLENEKWSRDECYPKRRIREETQRLLVVYECLNAMLEYNRSIEERFTFDIVKVKKQMERTLDKILDSQGILSDLN